MCPSRYRLSSLQECLLFWNDQRHLKDGTKDVAHPPAFTDCCSISFRGLMKKACQIATHYKIHLGNKDFFKAVYVLGD